MRKTSSRVCRTPLDAQCTFAGVVVLIPVLAASTFAREVDDVWRSVELVIEVVARALMGGIRWKK